MTIPYLTLEVHPIWRRSTADGLQRLAGETVWFEAGDDHSRVTRIAQALPMPSTPVEHLLLRGTLWQSAARLGEALHRSLHRRDARACRLDDGAIVRHAFQLRSEDPRESFMRWATNFYDALRAAHPGSPAERVARAIRESPSRPLDVGALANNVEMTPSGLRRAFHAEFGRTPRAYHAAVRLLSAIEHIGSEKLEAVALLVGYRSKKNFYRMFRSFTGQTPSEFRRLSASDQDDVIARARREVLVAVCRNRRIRER